MKKLCIFIDTCLVMATILTVTTVVPDSKSISVKRLDTFVNSSIITKEIKEDTPTVEDKEEDNSKEEVEKVQEEKKVVVNTPKEEESIPASSDNTTNTSTNKYYQGEVFTGKMSGYGSDIGTHTSSGYRIDENNITYMDSQYNEVRILAGDRKYPFGTIVRVSNSREGTFIGIVLDRGPDIGRDEGKKFAFDLLYATSSEARGKGTSLNAQFEILRLGY